MSTNSLSAMLNKLSTESDVADDINKAMASPEEITVVTNDTLSDLEETLQDIAEDVEKARHEKDAAEKMIDAIECLESKVIELRRLREQGSPLNALAAKHYGQGLVIALEGRGMPPALYERSISDLTLSVESGDNMDYSTEAEEKTEGLAARLRKGLAKALDAFIQAIKSLWTRGVTIKKNLTDLGSILIKKASNIDSAASPSGKVNIKGYTLIAISATSVDPLGAIGQLIKAAKQVSANENNLAKLVGKEAADGIGAKPGDNNQAARILADVNDVQLWGSVKLEIQDTGTYKLTGGNPAISGDVNPLTAADIREVGRRLIDAGKELEIGSVDQRALIGRLEGSITAIHKKLDSVENIGLSEILGEFKTGLSIIRSLRAELNSYALQVGRQAFRFASASAGRY